MNRFAFKFLAGVCVLALNGFFVMPAGAAQTVTPHQSLETVPAALRPALYQALAKDAGSANKINAHGCATVAKSALQACFDKQGAHFAGAEHPLSLHLVAYGRSSVGESNLMLVEPVRPEIKGNEVSYAHGNLTAWWQVLPVGFEQGFTISKRPAGTGKLVLALAASRQDAGAPTKDTIAWGKLRYGKLVVTDAHGQIMPSTFKSEGSRIRIVVNDSQATYPLVVDPLVWLEQKVAAKPDEGFAFRVAIDGATALVSANKATINGNSSQGAVYVFNYAGGTWAQTQKLTASDGEISDHFGSSVALDGTTALVGAKFDDVNGNSSQGAAYVFNYADGTWTQTQKLTASDGAANNKFGTALALDDTTAIITALDDSSGQGSAYVFSNADGTWTQTQKLTASGAATTAYFGGSVTLDGEIAIVGAFFDTVNGHSYQGAAYVFNDIDGTWTQTQKLTASDGARLDYFGYSVALDDTTALISAYRKGVNGNAHQGTVYVFTKSGGTWTQTQKLIAGDGAANNFFGISIALHGAIAIVGADGVTVQGNVHQGATYIFNQSGGTWTQAQKLIASSGAEGDYFGFPVAFDGTTVLVSAKAVNRVSPAVYFYGKGDLDLAVSAPEQVSQGHSYVSQVIATNSASTISPAVALTVTVPAAASFVSANATQGNCSEEAGMVTCNFGQIDGNAGTATANVTLKPTGDEDTTLLNTASLAKATPALTASAVTEIVGNFPPVASDGSLTTVSGQAAGGTLEASDPNGDPLTFSIVSTPEHGKATLDSASTGAYTYTPDKGYSGTDSFTFKANDSQADSNVATISITVNNNAPVANDGALSTAENTAASGVMRATDPDGDELTFSFVILPQHGEVRLDDAAAGAYTYTPEVGYVGSDRFGFMANDGKSDSNVANISISVIDVNGTPTASNGTLTTAENTAASSTLKATDPDGDPLIFAIVTPPKHGQVTIDDASTGVYTYTPAEDYTGDDAFSFKANDGTADSNTATVSVSVKAVNTPPVASDGTITTDENTAASGTLKASDPDGDPLTFSVVAPPAHGSVTLDDAATGAYTYTPTSGYSGSDGFTFKASDGQADSNAATVAITVKAVAPPPPKGDDGGGGGFGWLMLLAFMGLAFTGACTRRRRA